MSQFSEGGGVATAAQPHCVYLIGTVKEKKMWGFAAATVSPNDTWAKGWVKSMPKSVKYYLNGPKIHFK